MHKLFLVLAIVLSLGLILNACSDRPRGENLEPLTSPQKEEFKDATQRLTAILTSVSAAVVDDNDWQRLSLAEVFWFPSIERRNAQLSWLGLTDSHSIHDTLRERIKAALKDGNCKLELSPKIHSEGGMAQLWGIQKADATVSIKGLNCPIHYDEATQLRRVSPKLLHAEQTRALTIRVEDLIQLSGIREIRLRQKADLELSEALESVPSTAVDQVEGSVKFVKQGELSFYITLTGKGTFTDSTAEKFENSEGEIRYGLDFPDYTGELKFVGKEVKDPPKDSMSKHEHFLNNERVLQGDFDQHFRY